MKPCLRHEKDKPPLPHARGPDTHLQGRLSASAPSSVSGSQAASSHLTWQEARAQQCGPAGGAASPSAGLFGNCIAKRGGYCAGSQRGKKEGGRGEQESTRGVDGRREGKGKGSGAKTGNPRAWGGAPGLGGKVGTGSPASLLNWLHGCTLSRP